MRDYVYKTLGTNVIYSPMLPPSLKKSTFYHEHPTLKKENRNGTECIQYLSRLCNRPNRKFSVVVLSCGSVRTEKMSAHAKNSITAEFLTTYYFEVSFSQSCNPWVQNLKSAAIFTFKSHLIPFLLSTAKCPLLSFKWTAAEPSNILSTVKSFFIHLKTFNITVQPF